MSENTVTLVGNATKDPELSYTPSGVAKASFGLAVNRRWQNRQTQEWEEATSFFDIICWRELAENVASSIEKGARCVVVGRLEQRTWEDEGGARHAKVELVADEVAPSLKWATCEVTKIVTNVAAMPEAS